MNSTSTAIATDFVRPFGLVRTERGYLRLARVLTLIMGSLGTALALWFASSDIYSLWDKFMALVGLFGGSMCGLFCLGIFTARANGTGAMVGAFAGAIVLYWVQRNTEVYLLLYALVGIVSCFVTGYVASLVLPGTAKAIDGLTVYTLSREED